MKNFVVLFLLLAVVSSIDERSFKPFQKRWKLFTQKHAKVYTNAEQEDFRKEVFVENIRKIEEHNAKYKSGEVPYTVKVNKFADMTDEEFKERMGTGKGLIDPPLETRSSDSFSFDQVCSTLRSSCMVAPDYVDWKLRGAVTPVKNQGSCAPYWVFSAVAAMESQVFISTGKLQSLSEQQIIDCSFGRFYGLYGCFSGSVIPTYKYVIDNNGIATSKAYPYYDKYVGCQYKPKMKHYKIKGYLELNRYDEEELKYAVANIGPVSAVVDSSRFNFKFYDGGVFQDPECSNTKYDHAVAIVGYGVENGTDYWLIKNSWGTDWGQGGYLKLARNKNNTCSIATMTSIPLLYK